MSDRFAVGVSRRVVYRTCWSDGPP
jgi:hypothetical protein